MEQSLFERLYDVLDNTAMLLYESDKTPYLDGLVLACEWIMSGDVLYEKNPDIAQKLETIRASINDVSFDKETVRKAMQVAILKGLKHVKLSNQSMTPETIGILTAYLIGKLIPGNQTISMLDPLVGTGNYLTCVANQIDREVQLYGVEMDKQRYFLATAMFDMMSYGEDVYYQDTLTYAGVLVDVIVTDFDFYEEVNQHYFPMETILHHRNNLKDHGYFLAVIPNDFFNQPSQEQFRKDLLEQYQMIGLVKLPESLFRGLGKSILILRGRKPEDEYPKSFLLADVPSFEDQDGFANALRQINRWFLENHPIKENFNG